jgi:hypothetical protein
MKKDIINIIKILGIDCLEIVIDITLETIIVNSIEYLKDEDIILLHIFTIENGEEIDSEIDFDGLSDADQHTIYLGLTQFIYN